MSGIPSWARVGAKVVCVRRGVEHNHDRVTYPTPGETYTIREMAGPHPMGGAGIRLVEIRNPELPYEVGGWQEATWKLDRFRPLVTLEDDLKAHFSALLHVPASKETERA